ncbi:MAG TPA: hypothetical protein VL651_00980 [Bacteroidia bacterium]|jgi:hypothetical protein|nr:hypothetical protein [Bacteroidia bacterium]
MKTRSNKNSLSRIAVVLLLGSFLFFLFTRQKSEKSEASDPLSALLKEDSAATISLAAYPDSVRKAALNVCIYPDAILRIQELQKTTQQRFRDLVGIRTKDEQQRLWNITRYNGLAEELVNAGKEKDITVIAAKYPEDVREDATTGYKENYSTLQGIVALNKTTDSSFSELLSGYPAAVHGSFHTLVRYPELIELLGNSMRMAVKAGDLSRRYSAKLDHQFDSLSIVVAEARAKEAADWRAGLEKDSLAKKEFTQATNDYQSEHNAGQQTTIVNETVIVNYHCYPYPYWYGYPWWWDYPYWYPYPYWYACGYYYAPYGIVYFGYPTPYYMYWYCHHYEHHYYYCHFSDYCVHHYYGHRRIPSPTDRVVGNWISSEQPRLNSTFFTSETGRAARLSELGKEEINRADYNVQHPDQPMTRDEYIKTAPATYPNLISPSVVPSVAPGERGNNAPVANPDVAVPSNPNTSRPTQNPNTTPPVYKPKVPISQPPRIPPRQVDQIPPRKVDQVPPPRQTTTPKSKPR